MDLRIETLEDKVVPTIPNLGDVVGALLGGSNCSNGSASDGSCASNSTADSENCTGTDSGGSSGS